MSVNNTEQLRLWFFQNCPLLSKKNKLNVDYLPDKATEYAIFSVPSTLRYRENILGEMVLEDIQAQNFIFASMDPYGSDIGDNLENLGFYQGIVNWVLEQNAARNFPKWGGGIVRSIVPTITGAPSKVGSSVARYQIQLKVTYRKE